MKTMNQTLLRYLGIVTNGDLGPYTLYTNQRKRFVIFLKTWPKDPATYNQLLNRNRWRHAAIRWRSLDDPTRELWEQLSKKGICTVTGYNLFMYYILGHDIKVIQTLQRRTGLDPITPTGSPIPFQLQ